MTSTDRSYKFIVGLGAYAAISAQARLAKDADQAPRIFEHVAMARMSGRAWASFEKLEKEAERADFDLLEAIEPYEGILDEIDARLRPSTWWERLTKTYVAIGIFHDAMRELARALGFNEYADGITDYGHGDWTRERLEPIIAEDSQLEDRLSLWTRRCGGDALSLVRAFMFTNPEVLGESDADAIMETLGKNHKERLAAIHLHS